MTAIQGHQVVRALEQVSVPACMLDTGGVIVWTNGAAERLVGDGSGTLVGAHHSRFVAPEHRDFMQAQIGRVLSGYTRVLDVAFSAVTAGGRTVSVQASFAAIRLNGSVVGMLALGFGASSRMPEPDTPLAVAQRPGGVHQTPRQLEVLALLAYGTPRREIAALLGISLDTVRNHVRAILRALGARSQVAAIAEARRLGLIA